MLANIINSLKFSPAPYKFVIIFNYRSQLIITAVLVSVQFMATLVWVFAAFPDAKTYFPSREEVSIKELLVFVLNRV